MSKSSWRIILLITIFFIYCTQANAGNVMDNVYFSFQSASSNWLYIFQKAGNRIFWGLALISFVWHIGELILRDEGADAILAITVRLIIMISLFWIFLTHAPKIAIAIVQSMESLSQKALLTHQKFTPSLISKQAFEFIEEAINNLSWYNVYHNIKIVVLAIPIFIILNLIAINILVMYCTIYVVMYAAIFFLGFGGAYFTWNIAINYFKNILSLSTQLMVMILMAGILFNHLNMFNLIDITIDNLIFLLLVTITSFVLMQRIPAMVAGIISSSSFGSDNISGDREAFARDARLQARKFKDISQAGVAVAHDKAKVIVNRIRK